MYEILDKASRFNYYNYEDSSYSAMQCPLINIICEKSLVYCDNNKRLC